MSRELDDTILEIICDDCGSEYELSYNEEEFESPIYCPFCGTDLPEDELLEEPIEDEYIDEEELDLDEDEE